MHSPSLFRLQSALFAATLSLGLLSLAAFAGSGQVDLVITDAETGKPIGAKMIVRDLRGKVKRFPHCVWQGDATYVFYQANLKLPEGTYQFEVDAGPEYRLFTGHFEVMSGAESTQPIKMERTVNLKSEDWWVTEINVFGQPDELGVMLDGSGIDLGAWNAGLSAKSRSRSKSFHAPEVPRSQLVTSLLATGEAGAGFYLLTSQSPSDTKAAAESLSEIAGIEAAKAWRQDHREGLIIADSAIARELPLWLGLELIDGICLLPWFVGEQAEKIPSQGYELDRKLLRDNRKLAQWNEIQYFELLECGLKLPAAAASQWKTPRQALGTNRLMIAATDSDSNPLAGLQVGETWVTNGPLVRIRANGERPGHTFSAPQGGSVSLNLTLRVSTRYKLAPLEIIKNGEVIQTIDLRELMKNRGKIPPIEFTESGWLIVRAAAEDPNVYRVALTSPFYVDINQAPRVNHQAIQTQLDRLNEFLEQPEGKTLSPAAVEQARRFWQTRLDP
jgi:hypothetical protein